MTMTHTSLRIESGVMSLIDVSRADRTGKISRNTWIAEAIEEKLKREGRDSKGDARA